MNYNDVRSIVGSAKQPFNMSAPSASFHVIAPTGGEEYVAPTFTKDDFAQERPQFVLVSAVGASGKSALARRLSRDCQLPILDLGIHPPVADNTLTGLITTSYPIEELSKLLTALKSGTYGVIVDGIDEGRSKVNEHAFNAFLDDLLKLSRGSSTTSFVLLGRTQALIDCWVYLQDKGAIVGLASIDPFTKERAIEYIDRFAEPPAIGQRTHYDATRDLILKKLTNAFPGEDPKYLSFIGYPPVLDSIATLLRREKNYYKLGEDLQGGDASEVEANLLYKIATYILNREREGKIVPNVVRGLITELPSAVQESVERSAFGLQEQAARLLSYSLRVPYAADVIPQPGLNARYEDQLATFLPEHPFLIGGGFEFRNAIFEAVCIAILIGTGSEEDATLVNRYAHEHRSNLYLIQMLNQMASPEEFSSNTIHLLIGAALEFRSTESRAELTIDSGYGFDEAVDDDLTIGLDILIELIAFKVDEPRRRFNFKSSVKSSDNVILGGNLSSCFIELPCAATLLAPEQVELVAPVQLSARAITLNSPVLVIKTQTNVQDKSVLLEARSVAAVITSLPVDVGAEFAVRVSETGTHHYPLVKYVKQLDAVPATDGIRAKYLKLRKILTHFRSHSKGQMAKLRAKVEHERVAGNDVGRPVLERLIKDGVLVPEGIFYFLDPGSIDKYLGVSWMRLKEGEVGMKLIEYLRSIG